MQQIKRLSLCMTNMQTSAIDHPIGESRQRKDKLLCFPHRPRRRNLHLSATWFDGFCRSERPTRPTQPPHLRSLASDCKPTTSLQGCISSAPFPISCERPASAPYASHSPSSLSASLRLPRFGRVREEKYGKLDRGGYHGQTTTKLHEGI